MRIRTLILALLANFTLVGAASAIVLHPVTEADLGPIADGTTVNGTVAAGSVVWYSFMVAPGITYLDITTNGSTGDTEMGLYDSLGNLLASDDDDGEGLDSALSFGAGSGLMLDICCIFGTS